MSHDTPLTRRRALATIAAGSVAGLAGCYSGSQSESDIEVPPLSEFRGSGPLVADRPAPGGPSIADLPTLSGSLELYIGGGESGMYLDFIDTLEEIYPDFTVSTSSAPSSSLAQTVVEEVNAGAPQADLFWSIDASSLSYVTNNDAYEPLREETVAGVPDAFRGEENAWAGVAGRARSIPYNTDQLSASDIPSEVQAFPETEALRGTMGWAPTYGAFKSFVTAMRLLRGPEPTQAFLRDLREAGTSRFGDEFAVVTNVADGAVAAGFSNHYYALRVQNDRPDAPIDLAFTENDAGALVDLAGVLQLPDRDNADLVNNFVRHLLSAEAQEYFTTVSFAYPMIADVAPPGDLPTVDELNPPEIDLAQLSDLDATLALMRDAGVLG